MGRPRPARASGRVVVQRRSPRSDHGAGRLEFPGGKVEPGEAPALALARELDEEWGPLARQLRVGPVADVLHHRYPPPGPEVVLIVYHVDGARWCRPGVADRPDDLTRGLRPLDGASVHVFSPAELPTAEFLDADRPYAEAIRDGRVRAPAVWPWDAHPVAG